MDNPAESNAVVDLLHAVGVNVVAFIVGYPLAIVGPKFLLFILPFGMFWAYLLLVVVYAVAQFRKGRRRRAVLSGALAAIVLIGLMMNLSIA